ncbi:MAG: prolyl oligopeptidase family serine peptidase [Pirellulales bacterium]|nr:prolyl oligopeptidase family serine peptidase [Pirellulales bacterium]
MMKNTIAGIGVLFVISFVFAYAPVQASDNAAPVEIADVTRSTQYGAQREDFEVGVGRNKGFIVLPPGAPPEGRSRPWIWYAPAFVRPEGAIPDPSHAWMFRQFLAKGIAIGGVDVGESYGSPAGRATFTQFHRAVVKHYNLAPKACLLPQSRGGLMHYNWAAEHPECVQCVGGIYTVCDPSSWPGLAGACSAYGLSEAQFKEHLSEHNPLERLRPLAKAGIPILHIHGDADDVVPLERNSAELARRYKALGGPMTLLIPKGKGHQVCPEFFERQELVDFFIEQAERSAKAAENELDGK